MEFDALQNNIVFCFWFGGEMSKQRQSCFESMKDNLNLCLIGEKDLCKYELKSSPFHEGFEYLSRTHKSDYLRCYFMNFYGGCYSDIKMYNHNLDLNFKELRNSNEQIYGVGYSETRMQDVCPTSKHRRDFKNHIGNGCFIFKKNTFFTNLWLDKVNESLDSFLPNLKKYPGTNFDRLVFGEKKGYDYPLKWADMQGNIFHPLVYKYKDNFLKNLKPPSFTNYR